MSRPVIYNSEIRNMIHNMYTYDIVPGGIVHSVRTYKVSDLTDDIMTILDTVYQLESEKLDGVMRIMLHPHIVGDSAWVHVVMDVRMPREKHELCIRHYWEAVHEMDQISVLKDEIERWYREHSRNNVVKLTFDPFGYADNTARLVGDTKIVTMHGNTGFFFPGAPNINLYRKEEHKDDIVSLLRYYHFAFLDGTKVNQQKELQKSLTNYMRKTHLVAVVKLEDYTFVIRHYTISANYRNVWRTISLPLYASSLEYRTEVNMTLTSHYRVYNPSERRYAHISDVYITNDATDFNSDYDKYWEDVTMPDDTIVLLSVFTPVGVHTVVNHNYFPDEFKEQVEEYITRSNNAKEKTTKPEQSPYVFDVGIKTFSVANMEKSSFGTKFIPIPMKWEYAEKILDDLLNDPNQTIRYSDIVRIIKVAGRDYLMNDIVDGETDPDTYVYDPEVYQELYKTWDTDIRNQLKHLRRDPGIGG